MPTTAQREHGTRAKYVNEKCRCFPCRLANAEYSVLMAEKRRAGDQEPTWADDATLARVRAHVRSLQRRRLGLRRIAEIAGLSGERLKQIVAGRGAARVRMETAEAILGVSPTATPAGGAHVPAAETWRLLEELLAAGARKGEIARALGYEGRRLSDIGRERVTQRLAERVREVHDENLRVSPALRAVCRCKEQSQRRAA